MKGEFIEIFTRDLGRLRQEIEAFQDEGNLWKTSGRISNSAGNLCLHLIGNLKTYVGRNIGNYPYTRDREAEFYSKNISKAEILIMVDDARMIVNATLGNLTITKLDELHKEEVLGYKMTNKFFLIHLSGHLNYHLGQINYLRRILE